MIDTTRWVLAFDSSCGSCTRLSDRIGRACEGRLETLPLGSPEVTSWRTTALGEDAVWEPTLIRISGDDIRAWTGRSMIRPLARHLGMRSSIAVTFALGSLRDEIAADAVERGELDSGLTRKRFMQLGAGAVIAGTLAVTGQVPAYAAQPVQSWLAANGGKLPTTYDEFSAYPLDYRRGIYRELTPAQRGSLWSEQFARYRASHSQLTAEQGALIDDADQLARPGVALASPGASEDTGFRDRATAAFGADGAASLFAILGPAGDDGTARLVGCTCSTISDYCGNSTHCFRENCVNSGGCGYLWRYTCDGRCHN